MWLEARHASWYRVALAVAFLVYYLTSYFAYYALPGNSTYPDDWFGWFDQGVYVRSARALHDLDVSPGRHLYPFGYPLLGAPFATLLPNHPFLPANVVLTVAAVLILFEIYRAFLTKLEASALLLATFVFQYGIVENLVIPWNTIPTMTAAYAMSLLLLRGAAGVRHAVAAGALAGFTFLCRPGDVLFLLPLLTALSAVREPGFSWSRFTLSGLIGAAIFPLIQFALTAAVFGRLTSPYTDAVRDVGFSLGSIGIKLYSALFGAGAVYRVVEPMIVQHFPWLILAVPGLFIALAAGGALRRLWLLATAGAAVLCFGFYATYNDFDPVNLFKYHTFHYLAWTIPFLTLFAYLGLRHLRAAAARPAWLAAAGGALLLLLAVHIRISPRKARLEAEADVPSRLARCVVRTAADRTKLCDVELPVTVKRCANIIDLRGIVALEHGTVFLAERGRRLEEPGAFRHVAAGDRTRLIFHDAVCDRTVVVGVRRIDGLSPALGVEAFLARLTLLP